MVLEKSFKIHKNNHFTKGCSQKLKIHNFFSVWLNLANWREREREMERERVLVSVCVHDHLQLTVPVTRHIPVQNSG